MSVVVIGNDPSPISINMTFDEGYVFNQIYHMEKHIFPCPTRIFHIWNFLFKSKVKKRHLYLQQRCPKSVFSLITLREFPAVGRIDNFSFLSNSTKTCFKTFNKDQDGHPWTLGFFTIALLLKKNIAPHVYGFSHEAWRGHPVKCEKRAVSEWNTSYRLIYHTPHERMHHSRKRDLYFRRKLLAPLRKTSS